MRGNRSIRRDVGMSGWRSWATAALLLAGSTAGPALAVDESDLLPVDQAFALTATATAAATS